TVSALAELANPADIEAVQNTLQTRFTPGQVRLVDDLLLNKYGQEHINRTWESGNRPLLRKRKLTRRLTQLREGGDPQTHSGDNA
ncbi:hypothetical protein QP149_25685, partial [Escherichia coli]|nr:hypothetical protein [Escherichia coli]